MDMVAALNAPVLAVPKYGEGVQIWDTASLRQISSFATMLDYGGRRLALSSTGELLFTGSYTAQTISCHSTSDGQVLWRNAGLGNVQVISYNSKTDSISCGLTGPECMVISAGDGTIRERLMGVEWSIESPFDGTRLMIGESLLVKKSGGVAREVRRETFAVLSASFGNGALCFSEASGHVRCVDVESGQEIWRHRPVSGRHVLELVYFPDHDCFYGIEWSYKNGTGEQSLVGIDAVSGTARNITRFKTPYWRVLSPFDGLLYDARGHALDVKTGKLVKQLPFSQPSE